MWNKRHSAGRLAAWTSVILALVLVGGIAFSFLQRKRAAAADLYHDAARAWIQDDFEVALSLTKQAYELNSGLAGAALATVAAAQGDYLLRNGDQPGAEGYYRTALELDPLSPAALAGQGDAHLLNGELDAARAKYEAALKSDPDFPPALSGLALIAQQEGKVGAALELFKRALNPEAEGFDPGVIEAFARFVDQHTDQSVTFIEWLDGYLELYPDDLRAHVIAGDYFRRNANADRALQLWGWVYSQRPDYPKLAQRLGQLHAQRGNFVQAAEIFDKLQQAEPSADHFYLAATARANIPDLEGAKQLFEHGAREYPEDPRFPMGIGQVLYEQGDYEAARTRLLPLTEAPEPRFEVFRELGHVEIKRGFLDLADEWLAKAEALRPQDPLTHFQRGYLAARRGDRAAFEAHLQRVLDSGAVTMEDLAQFDNHVELFAIDWAREWLDRRTLVPPGQAR